MMGIGIGATMAPMTAAVMNAVGPERAGPGVGHDEHLPGGRGRLRDRPARDDPDDAAEHGARAGARRHRARRRRTQTAIEATAGHGTLDPSLLAGLPPEQRGAVVAAFRESWMSGFRVSLLVAGLVLLVAAVVANRFIPGRAHAREVTAAARVGESAPLEVA